jgi:hypothetical protein
VEKTPPMPKPKISARTLAKFHGLTIYGKLKKAKRSGKDRVLIQIRQGEPKQLQVSTCLSYSRAVDVFFATDSSPDASGHIL